jgi:hypothetical protein
VILGRGSEAFLNIQLRIGSSGNAMLAQTDASVLHASAWPTDSDAVLGPRIELVREVGFKLVGIGQN